MREKVVEILKKYKQFEKKRMPKELFEDCTEDAEFEYVFEPLGFIYNLFRLSFYCEEQAIGYVEYIDYDDTVSIMEVDICEGA